MIQQLKRPIANLMQRINIFFLEANLILVENKSTNLYAFDGKLYFSIGLAVILIEED